MQKIDLGNNESLVCGVFPNQDGTFTAMTYTKSKTFKTETGARRWLEKHTVSGNDSNLLIVFYVQIMPDDLVMQLHRF